MPSKEFLRMMILSNLQTQKINVQFPKSNENQNKIEI